MTAIEREVGKLLKLSVARLRERYAEAFGEPTRTGNKAWPVKRIAGRVQALAEGDLSELARRRAAELANDADLRLNPPKPKAVEASATDEPLPTTAPRLPPPGSILTRPYKGGSVQVQVLANGFEYAGATYPSLSAVAKAVTGSHCNGFLFFRLTRGARLVSARRPRTFPDPPPAAATARCAVYTRKSTEDGLEREFNSLDAQREAGEAYVASQRAVGWALAADRYDDGGFTGGNTDRPALKRLLADVDAGRVDCVVVYKVDRLSRSLLDFTRLMAAFEAKGVSFVSVTQKFNTATSIGRLVLNVLLSFAQFEREIIAEQTRDKIAAMRRNGLWAGGLAPLGYVVDPVTRRLAVNEPEAVRVRAVFALYREHGSLLPVVEELARRGWTTKRTATARGTVRGGRPFDRTNLYRLLTAAAYTGVVEVGDEIISDAHPALIAAGDFAEVQRSLRRNGRSGGAAARNRFGALLKGLLRRRPCGCAMTPTHTTRKGRRYRYYTCTAAQKKGHRTCRSRTVPAGAVEKYVVDRIRAVGRDPALVAAAAAAARTEPATTSGGTPAIIEAEGLPAGGGPRPRRPDPDLAPAGRPAGAAPGRGPGGAPAARAGDRDRPARRTGPRAAVYGSGPGPR